MAGGLGVTPGAVQDRLQTVTLTVDVHQWVQACDAVAAHGFLVMDWLSAVDQPPDLRVVAMFVRHPDRARGVALARILVRTTVGDDPLASLTSRWPSAAWHERETAEMFGIRFEGFVEQTPDGVSTSPRPLLTAGWPAPPVQPPLRKTAVLPARAARPWPGLREPAEPPALPGDGHRRRTTGRRPLPPGVPT